jgi:outer membrane protein assembly factor BamB
MVDVNTGQALGRATVGAQVGTSAAISKGEAILGHYGGGLVAVDIMAKDVMWTSQVSRQPVVSSPAILGDTVFFGSRDRHLRAASRLSGEVLWKHRTRGRIDTAPVACGGRVLTGSKGGRLTILDALKGDVLGSYDMGSAVTASPVVLDGRVYVGTADGKMRCLRPKKEGAP